MGTSQLLLYQDIQFTTSPPAVHYFIHETGFLARFLLRPHFDDSLLETFIKPVDHYEIIGRELAA